MSWLVFHSALSYKENIIKTNVFVSLYYFHKSFKDLSGLRDSSPIKELNVNRTRKVFICNTQTIFSIHNSHFVPTIHPVFALYNHAEYANALNN